MFIQEWIGIQLISIKDLIYPCHNLFVEKKNGGMGS